MVAIFFYLFWPESIFLPSPSSPLKIYSNSLGDDLKSLLIEAIEKARTSITAYTYSCSDEAIIDAFNKAAERGVDVVLVVDRKANKGLEQLIDGRISLIYRLGKGLMHRKILVIDGITSFCGSANCTTSSLQLHDNLVIGLFSHKNRELDQKLRAKKITKYTLEVDRGESFFSLALLPEEPHMLEKVVEMIRAAKKSIQVAQFTFTNEKIAKELVRAKSRGVEVAIISDRDSAYGASKKCLQYLQTEGITIRLGPRDKLMHHKFALIDGEICICGSTNWTEAAFCKNEECFCILSTSRKEEQDQLATVWQRLLSQSEKKLL